MSCTKNPFELVKNYTFQNCLWRISCTPKRKIPRRESLTNKTHKLHSFWLLKLSILLRRSDYICLRTEDGQKSVVRPTVSSLTREAIFEKLLRMTDEFRIQHLASVIQKSLKTAIKPDVIAKEFSDNKTPFVTAQVSHFSLIFYHFYIENFRWIRTTRRKS